MDDLRWPVAFRPRCAEVVLGHHRFDTRCRVVVIGVLAGDGSDLVQQAERLSAQGADALEIPTVARAALGALRRSTTLPLVVAADGAPAAREAIDAGASVVSLTGASTDGDTLALVAAVVAAGGASVIVEDPEAAVRAETAGLPSHRVVVATSDLDAIGPIATPVLWSALPDPHDPARRDAGLAVAVALGARLVRAHDVRSARRVADVVMAVVAARRS